MPKRRQLRGFDLKQIEGNAQLIGVDEAGRGALAGPVVAGAVLVTKEFLEGRWAVARSGKVNDSKQLTPAQRDEVYAEIEQLAREGQLHATCGEASVIWTRASFEPTGDVKSHSTPHSHSAVMSGVCWPYSSQTNMPGCAVNVTPSGGTSKAGLLVGSPLSP